MSTEPLILQCVKLISGQESGVCKLLKGICNKLDRWNLKEACSLIEFLSGISTFSSYPMRGNRSTSRQQFTKFQDKSGFIYPAGFRHPFCGANSPYRTKIVFGFELIFSHRFF